MKYILLSLIFAVNLFSQFSSNVDYKELSRKKNSFGVNYNNSMAENEWKTNFIDGTETVKFTGNYDFFKNDINLNGFDYFDEARRTYSVGFSKESYTSIVTIDTLGIKEHIDLGEQALSNLYGSLGYVAAEDELGCSVDFNLFSFNDSKCYVTSINGFINKKTSSGNKYGLDLTYALITHDSLLNQIISYNTISPEFNIGLHYSVIGEKYNFKLYSDVSLYDPEIYEDNSYIRLGLQYRGDFKKVMSSLIADVGTNVTSEFDIPEIPLPFLYYSLSLENRLFNQKISLKVGWQSEMYNAVVGTFNEISENIPDHYPAMFDLEETMTKNKLFIEVGYLY